MYQVVSLIAEKKTLVREFDKLEDAKEFRDMCIKCDDDCYQSGEQNYHTKYSVVIDE